MKLSRQEQVVRTARADRYAVMRRVHLFIGRDGRIALHQVASLDQQIRLGELDVRRAHRVSREKTHICVVVCNRLD
jgi:hypothetical protein